MQTVTLNNGLTVYLIERHDVPLISVRAVIKAGAVNDGKQPGLSNLTGDALLLGSRAHDKAAIDQAFDYRGARLAGIPTLWWDNGNLNWSATSNDIMGIFDRRANRVARQDIVDAIMCGAR